MTFIVISKSFLIFIGALNTLGAFLLLNKIDILHKKYGISASKMEGIADLNAVYGGMQVSIGVILFYFAYNNIIKEGLLILAILMIGLFAGRLKAVIVDKCRSRLILFQMICELSIITICGGLHSIL